MNMNLKFTGIAEQIMEGAVKAGLAKTKTDALMMGLLELDHHYRLLERLEDEQDARDVDRIMREVKEGKQKLYTQEEFEKKTGIRLPKRIT